MHPYYKLVFNNYDEDEYLTIDLKEEIECPFVILLGNEFQSEIECGTNEHNKLYFHYLHMP